MLYRVVILIMVCFCAICDSLTGQVITIRDDSNNESISSVLIIAPSKNLNIISDEHGQADISDFKDLYGITFQHKDFKNRTIGYSEIMKNNAVVRLERNEFSVYYQPISIIARRKKTSDLVADTATITSEKISFHNPQTAADMLSLSDKVYVQKSQQGGGSPMIRGFATKRLLYIVDGVRMNTAIFRGGNLQNVINIDPFIVEETDILFGPTSVLYGSDGIGGVMKFNTQRANLSTDSTTNVTGKFSLRYSSVNNERSGHFDFNIGSKKLASLTSVSYWDFDHLEQGNHGPDDYIKEIHVQREDSTDHIIKQENPLLQIPSAYSQFNLMQKIRFKPERYLDFEYAFHYSETSSYGRYDRNNRYRNGRLRYAQYDYGPQRWMMNYLSSEFSLSSRLYDKIIIKLAQQSFEESRMSRALDDPIQKTNTEMVSAYSFNLDLLKTFGRSHTIDYGIEFVMNKVLSTGRKIDIYSQNLFSSPTRYPDASWQSSGIYVQYKYTINNRTSLSTGIRYNIYHIETDFSKNLKFFPLPFSESKITKSSLTGGVGLSYMPSQNWIFKINLGTAFRAPNVDDLGKIYDSIAGSVVVPNPGLKEEYAYNIDVGVSSRIVDELQIDMNLFYTILDNAMVKREYKLNGMDSILYDNQLSQVLAVQNAAQAFVYGFNIGLKYDLPSNFKISTFLNYQFGKEELDDGSVSFLRHAAPLFGTTRLSFVDRKLQFQLYSSYMAERSADQMPFSEKNKNEIYAKDSEGNNYAPSWYTLNLKAAYKISEKITITTGVENITDQRYRPYSSGISGGGRNFIFSVSAHL